MNRFNQSRAKQQQEGNEQKAQVIPTDFFEMLIISPVKLCMHFATLLCLFLSSDVCTIDQAKQKARLLERKILMYLKIFSFTCSSVHQFEQWPHQHIINS